MEPSNVDVVLRPLTAEDVAPLARLAADLGRNTSAEDYDRFLRLEGGRGYALERDGRLVGAATMMRYFEQGFLGPAILEAGPDAGGLTIALFAQLIEGLQREGIHAIVADAGDAEEPILARMGFQRVGATAVWRAANAQGRAPHATRTLDAGDLLDVGVIDADAIGYGRKEYIDELRKALPTGARVIADNDGVAGYALLRQGARGYHLGPVVTRSADESLAATLLAECLDAARGQQVVALTPDTPAHARLLETAGFERVGTLSRMQAGWPAHEPSSGATEWARGGRLTG